MQGHRVVFSALKPKPQTLVLGFGHFKQENKSTSNNPWSLKCILVASESNTRPVSDFAGFRIVAASVNGLLTFGN